MSFDLQPTLKGKLLHLRPLQEEDWDDLFAAASDPRFNASTILGEIAKNYRLPLMDRLLMRFAIIPATRRAPGGPT